MTSLADNCLANTEAALGAMANEGDLSVEVVPVTEPVDVAGTDELARLAGTFNGMVTKARSTIDAYNAMRLKRAEFADVVELIGEGDLSSDIEPSSDKDRLGIAFAGMLASLRERPPGPESRAAASPSSPRRSESSPKAPRRPPRTSPA